MPGLIIAWAVGEGIIVWRGIRQRKPPVPGDMLATSALFVALAALAEYQPARAAAVAMAFGLDIAVLMQILPGTSVGQGKPAAAAGGGGQRTESAAAAQVRTA